MRVVITLERVLALILASLLAALGVVLVSSSSTNSAQSKPASSSLFNGPTMPPGLRAANFSLLDQNGHRVTLARYRGKVVVLTFIHSLCHGACPLMVEQIKGALNELPAEGRGVPAIGVSVAPWEDTRAHRAKFLAQHEMTGRLEYLNGSRSALARVWHAYAMRPVEGNGKIDDHSTFVLLIDKRGIERVGFAVSELTPEGLAHDIQVLQRERA
jgi:protein SCO1/2